MIVLDLSILNQKGTPMFNSDTFANRPTFGIVGRIFISTDTAAIYRDTGTAWDLIADGGSASTNIYNSNGTLSANRVVSDGGFGLSFTPTTHIGTAAIGGGGSGKLIVGSSTADNGIQIFGANSPSLRIDNAQSGGTQRFIIGLSTATNNFIQGSAAGNFCITTASAAPLLFGMWQTINASEVMRISTASNLIVGSTTDSGDKLQVNGTAKITGATQFGGNVVISLNQNASTNFNVTNTDVGINTKSEYVLVSRNGGTTKFGRNSVLTTAYKFINASDSYILNETLGDFAILNDVATGNIKFAAGGSSTAHLTISTTGAATFSGNVTTGDQILIGSSATVNGAMNFIKTNASPVASRITFGTDGTGYKFAISKNVSSTITDLFTLQDNGNVGIGTTLPSGVFHAQATNSGIFFDLTTAYTPKIKAAGTISDLQLESVGNGGNIILFAPGSTSIMQFLVNGTFATGERMRITTGGNLLINSTTDPGQKLYLNGSLRIDGQSSGTSGGNSGQHLIINLDGTTYKIKLELP